MHRGGVTRAVDTGHAALRQRRASVAERRFGHERHRMPDLGCVEGCRKTGDAGADDDDVHARGFAASIRSSATRAGVATPAATEI